MLPIIWLVAGALLAVAELFTLDFVLVMFAAGAFAAAISAFFGVAVPIQVAIFAIVAVVGIVTARPAIKRRLHRGAEPLTVGVEAIQGAEATVVEEVADGRGMVKIGGELWQARPHGPGVVLAVGERVTVIEVKGATAYVWKD